MCLCLMTRASCIGLVWRQYPSIGSICCDVGEEWCTTSQGSPPHSTTGCSCQIFLLLFPFHLLPSPVHRTGFCFCFFSGFLAIFILLSTTGGQSNLYLKKNTKMFRKRIFKSRHWINRFIATCCCLSLSKYPQKGANLRGY